MAKLTSQYLGVHDWVMTVGPGQQHLLDRWTWGGFAAKRWVVPYGNNEDRTPQHYACGRHAVSVNSWCKNVFDWLRKVR
eukprot:3896513-Amphidinium_carterae.1